MKEEEKLQGRKSVRRGGKFCKGAFQEKERKCCKRS